MRRHLFRVAACALIVTPALRTRHARAQGGAVGTHDVIRAAPSYPAHVIQQCTDAASDKLMNSNFGGAAQQKCQKQDVHKTGSTIVNSVCAFGGATSTTHAVISGSFDSAYTVQVTTTREGGPPMPGVGPHGEMHMAVAAKWLGPCGKGQRPGDIMMGNGMKMNVLDLQQDAPAAAPPP